MESHIQRKALSALILAALTPGPYQASAQRVYWGLNSTLTVSMDERTEQMIRDVSTLAVNHCDPVKRKTLAAELLAFRERYGQEDMPEPLQQDAPKWTEYLSEEDQDRLTRIFERGVYAYEQRTGYTPPGEPARPNRTPPEDEPVTFRIDGGEWTEWTRHCTDDEARVIRSIMERATERMKERSKLPLRSSL